jgi:hypothetical protein
VTPEHIVLVAESIAISVDKLSACQDLRSRYAPVEGKVEGGITIAAFENVSTGVVLRAARPAQFNRYILRAFRALDVDVFSYCHWRTAGLCSLSFGDICSAKKGASIPLMAWGPASAG